MRARKSPKMTEDFWVPTTRKTPVWSFKDRTFEMRFKKLKEEVKKLEKEFDSSRICLDLKIIDFLEKVNKI